MRRALCAVALVLACSPAWAQSATGLGVGVGISSSTSRSGAVAISGQGGRGGSAEATGGNANNSLTINNGGGGTVGGTSRTDSTLDQTLTTRGGTVNRQTGGLKNVPSVFAPGLAAAGLETCLGSVSGGGSFMGGGFSFGTTVPDPGCSARLDARTLWSFGLKKAAVARMCIGSDVQRAMPEVCSEYLPQPAQAGYGGPGPVAMSPGPARLEPVPYSGRRGEVVTVVYRGQERACADFDGRRCHRWAR